MSDGVSASWREPGIIAILQQPLPEAALERIRTAAGTAAVVSAPSLEALQDDVRTRVVAAAGYLAPHELALTPNLAWNHSWLAGVDRILHDELVASEVTLTSSAGNGAVPLAEHSLMLMLMLSRDMPTWATAQRERRWAPRRHAELAGKTVGIVGLGNAGRDLVKKARAFHMRVVASRRDPSTPEPGVDRIFGPGQVREMVAECDFVVVLAPLTDATRGSFDAKVLAAMKPSAFYVNVARGEIADEDALLAALQDGTIAGAGLDAHHTEPLPEDSPWWGLENVIITPHNAATTPETLTRGLDIFLENLERFRAGRPLTNVVDKRTGYSSGGH